MGDRFEGFDPKTLEFLHDLWDNNSKEWFDESRDIYEEFVLEPSKKFVVDMGERLKEISTEMIAEPKINRSLFRLNRDVRFSKDKSPYKTHIGIIFWEGPRKRMECPGFYFHFEPDSLLIAGGFHLLPKDLMTDYRKIVSREVPARELAGVISDVEAGGISVEGLHYKRTPQGFKEDHPHSYLIRYNGVYGLEKSKIPEEFFSEKLVDYVFERFKIMDPLNRWFLDHLY